MRILIVYAHPNPASFCHAILRTIESELSAMGHDIRVKDLYAEGFNPVLSAAELGALNDGRVPEAIAREQESLRWAEGLVLVYPLWWFDRPAILKGWFDKVLTNGFAFEYTAEGARGLLPQHKALIVVTVGGSRQDYRDMDAEELIIRPVSDGTLGFCGISDVDHRLLYGVPSVGDEARGAMLNEVRQATRESFART
jgi:NAD(P)H dehydrogenase (quinone)